MQGAFRRVWASSRVARTGFGVVLGGAALYAHAVAVEWQLLPAPLDEASQALYRFVYFLSVPGRRFFAPFFGRMPDGERLVWLALAYFSAAVLAWALWRVTRLAFRRPTQADSRGVTRRRFLAGTVGTAWAAAGAVNAYATLIEPSRLAVRRYRVGIRDLPAALDGLTLVHVSDTHCGLFTSRRYLERVFRETNALEPDLVVLTGDYLYAPPDMCPRPYDLFAQLRGRHGTVAVTGNHEHFYGIVACYETFERLGIRILDNSRIYLTPRGLQTGPADDAICVAGVGDLWKGVVRLGSALGGVPGGTPRVLLSHNPKVAKGLPRGLRVDLMLSGHTHGGQVRVPALGPLLDMDADAASKGRRREYIGGLYDGPPCPVIVSRGIGTVALPLRFGVPPEIGHITLTRA